MKIFDLGYVSLRICGLETTPHTLSRLLWSMGEKDRESSTLERGIPAFQEVQFGSRGAQPNLHSAKFFFFFFEALIFLVMLRNVATLHCCGCSGRKMFQLYLATIDGFLRRLPQTPVSISYISHPWPGSVKKWTWLYRLTVGSSARQIWTKYRASGSHIWRGMYQPAALVNARE